MRKNAISHNIDVMKNTKISLQSLRVFSEVAECLSFTQAANRLFRTQPAVSRQVADMELELGVALFFRKGRSLALTPAGHDLFARARAILGDVEAFSERARDMAHGAVGLLRVGATPMLFDTMMPNLLREYAQRWPQVRLKIFEVDSASVIAQVETRELDVGLTRYATTDSVQGERLFPMHLIAIVDRRHPLARRRSLELAELQDKPLLLMIRGIGSRVLIDQACRRGGYRLTDVRFESGSYSSLVEMAIAGHGIALVSSVVTLRRSDARIIPVHYKRERLQSWAAVHWHGEAEQTEYMRAFVDLARDMGQKDYPGKQYGL